jgi:hypothetical protein
VKFERSRPNPKIWPGIERLMRREGIPEEELGEDRKKRKDE